MSERVQQQRKTVFPRRKIFLFIVLYIGMALGLFWLAYLDTRAEVIASFDAKLEAVARVIPQLLPEDYHDRAVGPTSISAEEELVHRESFSRAREATDTTWLYTLVRWNGRFYFTAPTVTPEEARQQTSWYFIPYPDIPDSFVSAYESGSMVFDQYKDQWGMFRSVAIPLESPGGNRYLACVDIEISHFNTIMAEKARLILIYLTVVLILILIPLTSLLRYEERLKQEVKDRTGQLAAKNQILMMKEQELVMVLSEAEMALVEHNLDDDTFQVREFFLEGVYNEPSTLSKSMNENIEILIHPDDLPALEKQIEEVRAEKSDGISLDCRLLTPAGNAIWYRIIGKRFKTGNKNIMISTLQRINTWKENERHLLQKAHKDPLTGCYNRRFLDQLLEEVKKNSDAFPITICYIDVDGLKEVNDSLGHSVGDTLLTEASRIVGENLRNSDILCRLGGDEFVIIAPQVEAEQFGRMWDRILEDIMKLNAREVHPFRLSLSHGTIELPRVELLSTADQILALADREMYKDKAIRHTQDLKIIR